MRYTLLNSQDRQLMLDQIGVKNIDELFSDLPRGILIDKIEGLPEPASEMEAAELLKNIAAGNSLEKKFRGGGIYSHYIPAAIDVLASRSEFYTAYTPYQPEVSQGTLTAVFEFQTYICRLTGMDVTNASMYDGATSMAEAVMMSSRNTRKTRIAVSRGVNPFYREVLSTYAWACGLEIIEIPLKDTVTDYAAAEKIVDDNISAIVVQSPNFFGSLEDMDALSAVKKKADLIYTVAEALSLGWLRAPGEAGADIVCGEAQSFGNYPAFGGPMLGFISAKERFMRKIPGRLAGLSVDQDGNPAFTLTLQAREQHIRREKATSNICSNEGLLTLRAAVYLGLLGPKLNNLAQLNHNTASYLREKLIGKGFKPVGDIPFFNEFMLEGKTSDIPFGIKAENYYPEFKNCYIFCATENDTAADIDRITDTIKAG